MEELDEVQIHLDFLDHKVHKGARLTLTIRENLISFLKRNHDCCAWSCADMIDIDPMVAMHKLQVDLDYLPVKQKRRRFLLERNRMINEEI